MSSSDTRKFKLNGKLNYLQLAQELNTASTTSIHFQAVQVWDFQFSHYAFVRIN